MAPRRKAYARGRRADRGGVVRLRPRVLPQRGRARGARNRPLLLRPEARKSSRGAPLERRLHLRPGPARRAARDDRATVLIETILAAFETDEILWELRDHAAGLNCGRWDYIFSYIKKFKDRPECVLPDRGAVTMDQPFLRAYAEHVIRTCHRRGIHALGGMAA